MRSAIVSRVVSLSSLSSLCSSLAVVSIACLAGGLVACGGASDSQELAPSPAEATAATISVTEVGRNTDGTPKITQYFITREEQLAMAAARAASAGTSEGTKTTDSSKTDETKSGDEKVGLTHEAFTRDSTCTNGSSQWLYDGPGQTGNMLCLLPENTGSQVADLSSYTRTTQQVCFGRFVPTCTWINVSWSGAVKSYWNPSSSASSLFTAAWFQGSDGCKTFFDADGAKHDADACVAKARWLYAGQESLTRSPVALNVTGINGTYFPPATNVTVQWFKPGVSSPVQTRTVTADASGAIADSAWATCVGYGCGCTSSAQTTDAHGRVTTISLPDCLE